jgi:hypothetical protein
VRDTCLGWLKRHAINLQNGAMSAKGKAFFESCVGQNAPLASPPQPLWEALLRSTWLCKACSAANLAPLSFSIRSSAIRVAVFLLSSVSTLADEVA